MLFVKLPRVEITIVDVDGLPVDIDIGTNYKIFRRIKLSVLLQGFLPLQEDSLRHSGVLLFFFIDRNGVVLQVKADYKPSDSVVLQVALCNAFLEVPIKPKNMLI